MSLTLSMIDAMVDAKCTAEQIAAVVKADIAERDIASKNKREKDAERQRNHRKTKDVSHVVTVTECDNATKNTLDKSFPQTPFKINPKKSPPISPQFDQKFVDCWNDTAAHAGMAKAMRLSPQRKAKLKRRIAEFGEEKLIEAIGRLAKSPFHCGENDRNWSADIGWLLKNDENVTKALELKSDRAPKQSGSNSLVDEILARKARRNEQAESNAA